MKITDTIAAISTSTGNSGIGIIRVSGDEAIEIVDKIFKSNKEGKRLINVKWNIQKDKKYPSDILVYTNTYDNLLDIITKASSNNMIIDSNSYKGNKNFEDNMYSIIAGFVDAGEDLESTVKREVFEEVGIKIKNIKYYGNQTWAFPNSFMAV